MRVIAGKYRSRRLKTVDSSATRPTTDKNKENLFNMIGPYFQGGTCLDLFAGSGGLGIEALSRGMDELYSVDKQYKAFQVIRDNFEALNIENAYVYKMDYRKALEKFKEMGLVFDLVLLDPPYSMKINQSIIDFLVDNHMLNDGCMIVVEDKIEEALTFNEPFYLYKQQTYGITILQIIKYKGESS
ncbi:MAG: 16S rRNA (guanine(966)-N(2))-methyltransferase RsmD [Erysipelotrichaceae bacterium]|nr:16S rRNA (guanine(966)-N(2))-methyltransferase RsmD [Erysipelotrichaceae bacterium]